MVLMAPGPDEGLYVLIPTRTPPAVLALLDSTGRPRAGWPVSLDRATFCDHLLPVADGSVRLVCTLGSEGNMFRPIGAFAFDPSGRSLAGWPIELPADGYASTRVIGDEVSIHAWASLGDVIEEEQPATISWVMTVGADGKVRDGVQTSPIPDCCSAIGPNRVGYWIIRHFDDTPAGTSELMALGLDGVPTGFPIEIDGVASPPALDAGGQIHMAVSSGTLDSTRVLVFDSAGKVIDSAKLPIATSESREDTGGCTVGSPQSPVVADDGTILIYSELDARVYALDPSLEIRPGWPYEPAAPLVVARPGSESEHEAGYCPVPVVPAVGSGGTVFLPLAAKTSSVGGSLVAVGPNGRVRHGWPIELKRSGAEFWSVVVGSDGTVYALAIEPETSGASSATILAIAPDSTVQWTATIIDP